MRLLLSLFLLVSGPLCLMAGAQPAPERPQPAAPAAAPTNVPSPPPNYVYAPDGRRDPFVSLVTRGVEKPAQTVNKERPEGLAGVTVDELVVRGLVLSRGGWLAMVGAPSGKTYSLRAGDRLFDGNVRNITADAVVLMQDVADPKSLQRQREVRKPLRGETK
jgi:Tfp pilus assembly protein PilP